MAVISAIYGAAYGLLPIGWIILNILFLFRLVEQKGLFIRLQNSLTSVTPDQRLQLILVAVCIGSFFEGVSGFGAPVAMTSVILIGLGFPKLKASVLSLIANSTPVVFGSIGTGMIAVQGVTGLSLLAISRANAWQILPLNLILAVWLVWVFAGFKRMLEIWPAILVTSLSFTLAQTTIAVFHGPWLPTLAAAMFSLVCLLTLLHFWQPPTLYLPKNQQAVLQQPASTSWRDHLYTWMPWLILIVVVILWSMPGVKTILNYASLDFPVPLLDGAALRMPPVSTSSEPISAVFSFSWLSSVGTGVLFATLLVGLCIGHTPRSMLQAYAATTRQAASTLMTICLLVALGFITRYSGSDATLGLAFAQTGPLVPFFGVILGWLGVLSSGSITASNVLFGNLQKISASTIGVDPAVMVAANATGGVAGKLISPQSITITATATGQNGNESTILRATLIHSLIMVVFMGVVVMIQVYLFH